MKAISFKIPTNLDSSLRVQIDQAERFYNKLHFHPEYQITAIVRGEGVLYFGNSFTQFSAGDVFVLGSNIAHMFQSAPENPLNEGTGVLAISLFFTNISLGPNFFELPELLDSKKMLQNSYRGMKMKVDSKEILFQQIIACEELVGLPLIGQFLQILDRINTAMFDYISSHSIRFFRERNTLDELDKVIDYTTNNVSEPISLQQIAAIAQLSVSQFSKRFKAKTNKTYIQFLNELRVETACTSLRNSRNSILQISIDVGFKNLANFNRQFRKIKNMSPSQYRKRFTLSK